eukprot:7591852-Pyramimonas_sp.AAC.1
MIIAWCVGGPPSHHGYGHCCALMLSSNNNTNAVLSTDVSAAYRAAYRSQPRNFPNYTMTLFTLT